MSNIDLILPEKAVHIGNFLVGRLLPFMQKRAIGPFVFIDHMGPVAMHDNENFDVGPHPHIGLSTLTYLFEGAVMHRDSLGNAVEIQPGAVNWMTAGKGITHSERTPEHLRHTDKMLHGLQLWVALPKEKEEIDPSFVHIPAGELPVWEHDGATYKLIAGQLGARKSAVPVYSKLYMLEIKVTKDTTIDLVNQLYGESGLHVLEGSIKNQEHTYQPGQLLVTLDAHLCVFDMTAGSTVYLFGGEPFPEERFIYWNFVATSRERIEQAKADWSAQKFPKVPGETGFTPLPPARNSN